MLRRVEPEWLDQLPTDDPRAIRCRRDLKRANALMLQHILMARTLLRFAGGDPPRALVDLGSGDGMFMLRVARRLARHWRNVHVILLDQQNIVNGETRDGFTALRWTIEPIAANVRDFFSQHPDRVDVVTANLFLHHLQDPDLQCLLAQAGAATRLFVACEPRRTRLVRELGRMQWLIGGGDVFCHDAVVSVRASFLGKELSAFWPRQDGWDLFEHAVGPLAHVFVARRRAA